METVPLRSSRGGPAPAPAQSPAPRLPERERRVLLALAETVIPAGDILPAGGEGSVARLERWLTREGPGMERLYRGMLWSLELAPLATRGRRFSRLGRAQRLRYLERWGRSNTAPVRAAFLGLLSPLKGMHADSPELHALLDVPYGVRPPAGVERPGWMANALDGHDLDEDEVLECDVVIVGSGAGGAALAYDLAVRGHAVLLVEAGRFFTRADFDGNPPGTVQRMYLERGMTVGVGNLGVPIWAGRTVGGTTTVNSGTCYRTPDSVLNGWGRDFGLTMLSPDVLAPHFERVEQMLEVEEAPRAHLGAVAEVVARGAGRLGYAHGPLRRNAPGCDGQGVCAFGCPTGAKRSADVSWIPGALARGAMLLSSTRVDRVDADESTGRAVGITARTAGGATIKVRARATVVSGGALMTPLLLARSGLCPDNPWLGRNLSIHPACKAVALMPDRQEMWRGIPQSYCVEQFTDEGIMFEGGSLPFVAAATSLTNVGPAYTRLLESYPNLSLFGFMIRDTSRGRVLRRPGSRGPAIAYHLNRHDLRRMRRAMGLLVEIFLEAGATEVYPGVTGTQPIRSRRELDAFRSKPWPASRFEATAYHPLGTARMGRSARDSVVGPDHESHDVRDLYVVDGSAVPSSLGVNPQITIMAMALRAGAILDRRLS